MGRFPAGERLLHTHVEITAGFANLFFEDVGRIGDGRRIHDGAARTDGGQGCRGKWLLPRPWAIRRFKEMPLGIVAGGQRLADSRRAVTEANIFLPAARIAKLHKELMRIGKLNGIFAPVSAGAHPRNPAAWTLHCLCVPLPAPAGQRAGEVRGASPACSGGAGLGTTGDGRQGRDDGTRECPGSARTSPMERHHGSWT